MRHTVSVFQETKSKGLRLIASGISHIDAFDYVWSEDNTEEHPIHIFDDETGSEIEW